MTGAVESEDDPPIVNARAAADGHRFDGRGIPTHACVVCGGRVFTIGAMFDDYDIACWFLDATCATCGALLTAPCPVDRPDTTFED